jgi:hypothetical protein
MIFSIIKGGTHASLDPFVNVRFGVEPAKKAYNGAVPPPSSQSMPTAWLFKFVESFIPLNQGWRSTGVPIKFPGLKIPVMVELTLESGPAPPNASAKIDCISLSCVAVELEP